MCGNSELWIVESSWGFAGRHDLLLVRVLVQPKGDMQQVQVINLSPAPINDALPEHLRWYLWPAGR